MSKLTDFLGGLGAHDDEDTKKQKPLISEDMLENLFTYHKWSPEQVERGNAIRAAAKAFARIKIQEEAAAVAFIEAIKASAPEAVDEEDPQWNDSDMQTRLRLVAAARREEAIDSAERFSQPEFPSKVINTISLIVMLANSAITFEAATLEPIDQADAHSERLIRERE